MSVPEIDRLMGSIEKVYGTDWVRASRKFDKSGWIKSILRNSNTLESKTVYHTKDVHTIFEATVAGPFHFGLVWLVDDDVWLVDFGDAQTVKSDCPCFELGNYGWLNIEHPGVNQIIDDAGWVNANYGEFDEQQLKNDLQKLGLVFSQEITDELEEYHS